MPKRLRAAHARCLLGNVERSAYLEKGRLEAYEALILRLNVTDIEEAPRG